MDLANWEKFWSFRFSLLGASILADYYPKIGINNIIIISKKGYSTCYLLAKERKEYGLKIINLFFGEFVGLLLQKEKWN